VTSFLKRFADDEQGSTAVEYSIIAVLISIVGVGALMIIGPAVSEMFSDAGEPF
jgi:Flp pilus assembly pilin Flp